MRENNKTKLKIQQVLSVSLVIMFLGIFTTIYGIQNTTPQIEENNEIVNEDDISKTQTRTSSVNVTSRFSRIRETLPTNIQGIEDEVTTSIEDVKISKNMDLTVRTGLSKEDFKKLIKNTKQDSTKFFYNNSDTIYDLCEEYQINEIFLCGLIAGESGWNIASNHRRTHNYISLMSNGKLLKFATTEQGLEKAASTLHNNYLSPSGRFYSGKTLSAVKKKFCPGSSTWVNLIYTCMSKIVN